MNLKRISQTRMYKFQNLDLSAVFALGESRVERGELKQCTQGGESKQNYQKDFELQLIASIQFL